MKNKRSNALQSDGEVVAEAKKKRERSERSKQWQLTENNPSYTKQDAVERLASVGTAIYGVGCSEVGESGTSHIHAYVIWKNAIELSTLKALFPRAHFEHCRGSVQSNVEYVTKDDAEPYEVGETPVVVSERKADVAAEVVLVARKRLVETVVRIQHARHPVEAESVDMVFVEEEAHVGEQKMQRFGLAVVEAERIPARVFAAGSADVPLL